MYSIEWQKRSLPHAHILLWLKEKIQPNQIDDIISAELPDPREDPELFEVVKTQMVHGSCSRFNPYSPCMDDGKYTKRFPRELLKETQTGQDGYPLYRRRKPEDRGFTTKIKARSRGGGLQEVEIDNRWIVPYSTLLSRAFKAHINVELAYSVNSINYVCKYINKGSDMAVFNIAETERDEVKMYQTGSYISSNEAVWSIFGFPIHEGHPSIEQLAVHLENGQRVYFRPENAQQVTQGPSKDTTLTTFFKPCQEDDFARTLFYWQVPSYYTWNTNAQKWQRRKQGKAVQGQLGIKSSEVLGRVYSVHLNQFECFFLRMLLFEIRGPQSFEQLRTIAGQLCQTYREACQKRGMLEGDTHWDLT